MTHEKYVVRFSPVSKLLALPILTSLEITYRRIAKYELILERLRTMHDQWQEKQSYYEVMCESLFAEVLVHVQRECDQGAGTRHTELLLIQMKEYLQDHYREQVTKEELGAAVGRSPNYTATLFRGLTGQTISDYVHALRVKTAIYMLRHSALNVTEIAEFVGYADPSYFYRIFKKLTGEVPTTYLADRESVRK
ncbi:helix-turn-helix transcriptional regulator [Paenibacillus hexagrammi]|uniref:AraC family transcriptional regulator n=1 Tax=Paenibacillus hexagrammi TaxID=2908839 RepID=A0ABY3SHY6_9BACL|nr:AraC family transcriptional regulator [Paenibacillus sp. YPD9-1]UJF33000.1 AraC family transcriptional regulator [Paenibacillus sp. YPD9-1]